VLAVVIAGLMAHAVASDRRAEKLREEDPPIYVTDNEGHKIRLHNFSHHDPPSAGSAYRLPCTSIHERTNFPYFSVGSSFEGLPVTHMMRGCGDGKATRRRSPTNEVTIGYGSCQIPSGATGCTLPIDVNSYPACQRNLSQFDVAHGPPIKWKSGAITVAFEGGGSVDIYTGRSTITIYGHDPDQVARALDAIRKEPPGHRVHPPLVHPQRPVGIDLLPPPAQGALKGKLRCVHRSSGRA
jgi:hypothetical protein